MQLANTKGIFFDIDGTLSDSFRLGFTSTQKVLNNNGFDSITEDAYHQGTKYTTPRRLAWHTMNDPDHPIGEQLGKQFDDLYVGLVSPETAPLYDGIDDMLNDFALQYPDTVKLAALSNACGAYVQAVMKTHHLTSKFSIAYGADDVPAAKPNPDGLLAICQQLELEPENCVYIGDSPSDGRAARSCNMHSIGVSWGSHSVESISPNFDKVVHTVQDLNNVLREFINQGKL